MGIKTSCFKYLLTLPHSHLFVFKTCIESQNDLVARDIKDHRAPKPRLWAGTLPLDQVAQRPIYPGLEHYQDWGIHFTGQLVLCLTDLTVKNYFLISNLNLLSFRLKPFPLVLSVNALKKSPSPSFWQASFGSQMPAIRSHLSHLFLRLNKSYSLSLPLQEEIISSFGS